MVGFIFAVAFAVQSQVTDVTVYNDRARVERAAEVELKTGLNTIRFDNLPEAVDFRGIQVDGRGSAVVLNVRFKTENFKEVPDERWKALLDEKRELEEEETIYTQKVVRLKEAKAFLKQISAKVTHTPEREDAANQLEPGSWESMLTLYTSKNEEYDEAIRLAELELVDIVAELNKVQADISDAGANAARIRRFVEVDLEAAAPSKAELRLSYIVNGPKWTPTYDIRVDTQTRGMEVKYYGLVRQNTGEDWSDVALRLSTANPGLGGKHPELDPWRIRMARPARAAKSLGSFAAEESVYSATRNAFSSDALSDFALPEISGASSLKSLNAGVDLRGASVVFDVNGENSIESDNVEHRVAIATTMLPSTLRYSAVPKIDPYAYLKAKAVNAGDHPFLAGEANIFLDGDFVTSSRMELVAPDEEFWVFLGADESMKVEHKLLKKYQSREGMTGKTVRHAYEYLMTIKNTHAVDEEVIVWDQLPISGSEGLKVKLLEPKYAKDTDALKIDDEQRISWFKTLAPGEEWEIPLSFHVETPRDMKIDGLE